MLLFFIGMIVGASMGYLTVALMCANDGGKR